MDNFDKKELSETATETKKITRPKGGRKKKTKPRKDWEIINELGKDVTAYTGLVSEPQCLDIIAHWKRLNKIDGDSKDLDSVITDYIHDFNYRLIAIPKSLQYDKFETGLVKPGMGIPSKDKKDKKFKSAIYYTEKEFEENFVKYTDLHDHERENYAKLVDIVQNAQPKIDFESEFVLVLHLGIAQEVVVDLEKSLMSGKLYKDLYLDVLTSQRRKWARYSSFVWCIVVNKKKQFKKVKIRVMNSSFSKRGWQLQSYQFNVTS